MLRGSKCYVDGLLITAIVCSVGHYFMDIIEFFPKYFHRFQQIQLQKYLSLQLKGLNLSPFVLETRMPPQCQQDTCERRDLEIDSNLCFSDLAEKK